MAKLRDLTIGVLLAVLIMGLSTAAADNGVLVLPIPARIGGTVSVDGTLLTPDTDTGYTFAVTRANGTTFVPPAADTDGLNASNWYVIDIPIYDATDQPGGANPGEAAVLRVYKDGIEQPVLSPVGGNLTVGTGGSRTRIDLQVGTAVGFGGRVLVAADDAGVNADFWNPGPAYAAVIKDLGYTVTSVVNAPAAGDIPWPPDLTAANYEIVVVVTGENWLEPPDNLGPADEAALAAYLASGGCVLLVGQDVLYGGHFDWGTATGFFRDYMGLDAVLQDSVSFAVQVTAQGSAGGLLDGMSFQVLGASGGGPFELNDLLIDTLTPVAGASALLKVTGADPCAIAYAGSGFKSVFSTLELAATDYDSFFGSMQRILGWFGAAPYPPHVMPLVESYYTTILDRAAEPGGAESWRDEIARIMGLGIDVKEGFIALAMNFFNSQEYQARNTTDGAYVTDLYETFLQRMPSTGEVDTWTGELAAGLSRSVLLTFFAYCDEFKVYMEGLFGAAATRPENNLVNDFYRGLLHRLPDSGGFESWRDQVRTAQCTGAQAVKDVAYAEANAFFGSGEYDEGSKSDTVFVEDLYNAFLRRGADAAGFNYWVSQLSGGHQTRAALLGQFVNSVEFQGRVTEVIDAGCLPT